MEATELRAQLEALHPESFGWALACSDGDRERAESVLQRSYLKVLEGGGAAAFQGRSSFKTWFFGVVRNTAREERRRAIWRKLRLLPPEAAEALPHRADAEADLAGSELRASLLRMLAKLPRRQREVLHLVFYQELSVEEAARAMDVSVGSARTHYERGKKKLRELLETKAKQEGVVDVGRARA